jgi:hypothetical protein
MIPALRASFGTALEQLNIALLKLRQDGSLPGPWLGDEVSDEVAAYYSHRAMEAPDSSYQSLQEYRSELGRIHDTLQRMEDNYRRTEGANAARWGQRP